LLATSCKAAGDVRRFTNTAAVRTVQVMPNAHRMCVLCLVLVRPTLSRLPAGEDGGGLAADSTGTGRMCRVRTHAWSRGAHTAGAGLAIHLRACMQCARVNPWLARRPYAAHAHTYSAVCTPAPAQLHYTLHTYRKLG
jgi:hypothetical protein